MIETERNGQTEKDERITERETEEGSIDYFPCLQNICYYNIVSLVKCIIKYLFKPYGHE